MTPVLNRLDDSARRVDAARRSTRRLGAGLFTILGVIAAGGCEADGWLGEPSVVGRWEHTPGTVPILEKIDVIESDSGEFVDVSQVTPEDLIPEPVEYTLAPGDFMRAEIYDLVQTGVPALFELNVDGQGFVSVPQLGRILVDGMSAAEVEMAIRSRMLEAGISRIEPLVSVQILGRRQQTFSVFGAISNPARYSIPYPDYRILDALTDAGGVSPIIDEVYVIRQIPLADEVTRGLTPSQPTFPTTQPQPRQTQPAVEDLSDLIDELTRPADSPSEPREDLPEPGMWVSPSEMANGDQPFIDLDPPGTTRERATPLIEGGANGDRGANSRSGMSWVFLDGRWIQVMSASQAQGLPEGPDPLQNVDTSSDLVTQRIIAVPVEPLIRGVAKFNIIVRPGDVIHVPSPVIGVVYMGGPGIARGGSYNLPTTGRFTLQRAIIAAGGFNGIAIPERVDLTRVVGESRQATIRLDVRSIFEGTHPDIYLKPDDIVNVGTNFWATPMAVIRNGFRMSYGFGFLLDRNFGNDVFGAPPSNVGGGN